MKNNQTNENYMKLCHFNLCIQSNNFKFLMQDVLEYYVDRNFWLEICFVHKYHLSFHSSGFVENVYDSSLQVKQSLFFPSLLQPALGLRITHRCMLYMRLDSFTFEDWQQMQIKRCNSVNSVVTQDVEGKIQR